MSYQCHECNRAFKTQFALTGHTQTHKKVKPIEIKRCPICDSQFDCIVRRANGQLVHNETCSRKCGTRLRINRCTESKKPDVIAMSKAVHGDKFDYSKTVYVDANTPIIIGCQVHGFNEVNIYSHIRSKHGCMKCSAEVKTTAFVENVLSAPCTKISKQEIAWLDDLCVPVRQFRAQTSERIINVDGYDPATNTVYLFHGVFWHGHPDHFPSNENHPIKKVTYGELYKKTLLEERLLRDAGFTVVSKWG